MPTAKVNGKVRKFPYTPAGKAQAARAAARPPTAKPSPVARARPTGPNANASATAKSRAFGQRGAAMRKRR